MRSPWSSPGLSNPVWLPPAGSCFLLPEGLLSPVELLCLDTQQPQSWGKSTCKEQFSVVHSGFSSSMDARAARCTFWRTSYRFLGPWGRGHLVCLLTLLPHRTSPFSYCVSWDRLPDKLWRLRSLSQDLLLGEAQRTQWVIFLATGLLFLTL